MPGSVPTNRWRGRINQEMSMTSDTPAQRITLRTQDFCELQEASTGWDQDYVQLSPGQFSGSLEMVQVGTTQIGRECWGRKIRYRGAAPPGTFGFALALEQAGPANWVGRSIDLDTVIVQAPGREADLVSPENWDALVFSVPKDDVETLTSEYSGEDTFSGALHGAISLNQDVATNLRQLGRAFLHYSSAGSDNRAKDVAAQAQQLVTTLLWDLTIAHDTAEFFAEPAKHAVIVDQATELALSDSGVRLAEICAQLGVSLRTLHYAFQDVTGMSPATWLRRIRLNQVHKTLQRSRPGDVLIRAAAKQCGYRHFSHFSEQYQRLFGTMPSQTLHSSKAAD